MRQAAYWHRAGVGAGAAVLVAVLWASASLAAPGAKHCRMARGWVQGNCGSAAGREGTPARCVKARGWVKDNCPDRIELSSAQIYRSEVYGVEDDDAGAYVPRPRRVHKVRGRAVHARVRRSPRPSRQTHRERRYKDRVFVSDYPRLTGNETAFYAMLDKDKS